MKYGDWTLGQTEALLNLLGGQDEALAVLKGEKILRIDTPEIKLFDKNGRRIPLKGLRNAVCDPNTDFRLVQPEFKTMDDYAQRLIRFRQMFSGPLSAAYFEDRIEKLIGEIKNNKFLTNLLNGIYLPTILPRVEAKNFDYGTTLEQVFLPAVEKAYKAQFPDRSFYNYRKGELANQVSIVEGSCHEKLVEKMKQGIIYGIYFPNPFQGFSILAARKQMSTLPESLILSGGFDTCMGQVMYPDVLARDYKTPGYNLSALQWQSSDYSLCFKARGYGLDFHYRANLDSADDSCSSGLLFLGSAI